MTAAASTTPATRPSSTAPCRTTGRATAKIAGITRHWPDGGGAGGGIFDAGDLLLRQSTVSGNASGPAAAAAILAARAETEAASPARPADRCRLVNSTLSGNRTGDGGTGMWQPRPCASGSGGGIYTAGGFSSDNSTIAANRAGESTSGEGGGIFIADHCVSMRNTILAKNTATGDGQDCKSPSSGPRFTCGVTT